MALDFAGTEDAQNPDHARSDTLRGRPDKVKTALLDVRTLAHRLHGGNASNRSERRPRVSDPRSDARRPTSGARLLGQVLTPDAIAQRMATLLFEGRSDTPARVLDPAVGPGTLLAAASEVGALRTGDRVTAFDVDAAMTSASRRIRLPVASFTALPADYLLADLRNSFDFAIANPPWIRQEWILGKDAYRSIFMDRYRTSIPGTSNLYVYFLVKLVHDLAPGGRFSVVVYDSWRATQYGKWLVRFLEQNCSELTWIPIADQPFDGRLIDASLVLGTRRVRRDAPGPESPRPTSPSPQGLVPLSCVAACRRGLRLKQTSFFLVNQPAAGATPFVKKIGRVKGHRIPDDHREWALLIHRDDAKSALVALLQERLRAATKEPDLNKTILTWHRERPGSWFLHGTPPVDPILFNYYIRNRPRHILNTGRAFSDNFYGVTPLDDFPVHAAVAVLNSSLVVEALARSARSQGNGLSKLQLFEYRNVLVPDWRKFTNREVDELSSLGIELTSKETDVWEVIRQIDRVLALAHGPHDVPRS